MKLNFYVDDHTIYMKLPVTIEKYILNMHNIAEKFNEDPDNIKEFNISQEWYDIVAENDKNKIVFDYIYIKDNKVYMYGFDLAGGRIYHPDFDSEWLFEKFMCISSFNEREIIVHTKMI